MSRREKKWIAAITAFALAFGVAPAANAMHIMEGYLPLKYCVAWGVFCLPFLAAGVISIRRTLQEHRKVLLLLAMAGAFAFVLSALKIPSVTGSSSHMTGTGLAAILFGPTATSVLGMIVLLFQAVLLAHGGLTTLGANTFSMAIAGPLLTFAIWQLFKKKEGMPKYAGVFLAASLGDLFTYCITSLQLGLAYSAAAGGLGVSVAKFLGIFAATQIPLAVIEGLISVVVVIGLETYAKLELREIGFLKGGRGNV
ncbi:MAG: energy-coupling factor ABC transporter permease [Lachnospiraceae bacterium]|jgi:cobalt/nickel transport system permease protein|nr:energy-coupling factor ABC transporter permease [Lachnospiraceae bacterium]MCI9132918.1 energy-coupling factor ABC transporter permease [Lachnospiraceae bacterium]